MGAGEIKSIIISFDKIRNAAEQFRQDYIHNEDIPVNIEWHVEAAHGIAIIPVDGLHSETQIDGLISKDLKYIYVDNDLYNDDRYQGRIRFTIAHEIGHYILHYDTIQSIKCKNEREWIEFCRNMDEGVLSWYERQAHEFAGRLLVPIDPLVKLFMLARSEVVKNKTWNDFVSKNSSIPIVSSLICDKFGVSSEVIEIRLKKESSVRARLGLDD